MKLLQLEDILKMKQSAVTSGSWITLNHPGLVKAKTQVPVVIYAPNNKNKVHIHIIFFYYNYVHVLHFTQHAWQVQNC